MSWRDDVRLEIDRANEAERAGNSGRVRTCLRRAVGHVLTEWQRRDPAKHWGRGFMDQVRALATEPTVPSEVREAAERLGSRIGQDFRSRSVDPMEDARTILAYALARMGEATEIS